MYNSKVQDPSVTDNDQIKDHLRWQFVVSFFIENLYVFMDFIVELTHVQNQMFIVESNMRQHFYLEWLLWVLSTNLCILETLNFLNWGILLSSYYQLPNMYCIRMREESAVFKFIYREFSTKWHTCIYCDSICHSFNENLDWNTNCETFIYNIKPRTTSNKHLFLSALSLSICSALCGSPCCADSEKFSVQWVTSYSLLISCWPVSVIKLAVETASVTMEIREKSGECPLILQMRGAYRFLNFGSYEICLLCLITTALLKKKYGDVHGIISQ